MNTQGNERRESPQTRFIFDTRPHGEGGFARVIRGKDQYLEREVAVKVLNPLATQFSAEEQERFRREARILARLSHPNIPSVYDVDFSPGRFLILSQFIEGITLRKLLDEQGAIDFEKARIWFHQLASALDHAHALGIIHRDVKPSNIIIANNGDAAYLVDFGIALSQAEVEKLTKTGYWIGTPGYMSPEQHAGDAVDYRSDLYSLGVTLFEALSGKPIPQGQYQDLAMLNQAIPPQVDDLVRSCLEIRDRRIESAKIFGTRLASAFSATRPIAEVLSHGRLHEIALAVQEMSSDEFMKLPAGQRTLVLVKLDDVVESDEPTLQFAAVQFLELLVTRGILLDRESYTRIVAPAIERAFQREYGQSIGRRPLRDQLEKAATIASSEAHSVLQDEFLKFLESAEIGSIPDYILHACREMLQSLLANPVCGAGAKNLAACLRKINREQTQRG